MSSPDLPPSIEASHHQSNILISTPKEYHRTRLARPSEHGQKRIGVESPSSASPFAFFFFRLDERIKGGFRRLTSSKDVDGALVSDNEPIPGSKMQHGKYKINIVVLWHPHVSNSPSKVEQRRQGCQVRSSCREEVRLPRPSIFLQFFTFPWPLCPPPFEFDRHRCRLQSSSLMDGWTRKYQGQYIAKRNYAETMLERQP
ncbi:hypothetical protein SISSUDRAFT_525437 [Sistotremastrum suecicum HHB10207 ss-3]|uniref:Uncharacterized protein n=1 Tax=Sistotremastrum suecicum HHB10207 ss-3 TaxID=1314776 RepID=A0A166F6K3_9AGAM|nr:hypothetical protein SISSUDRAFT_525437 [Sistotremastrum suecicum HHB10207 ss-3]